jgi:hypothetical protein
MRLTLSLAALAVALILPASAAAHSTVSGANGEVVYTTEDVTSANCLVVRNQGVDIKFIDHEPGRNCVDFGMNASGDCRADGEPDTNGYFYEASCTRAGKTLVRIDVGDREDKVTTTGLDIPVQILAGTGADTVTAGATNDVILGGTGNDTLDGGAGNDLLKDEDGDDTVKAGAGNDQIQGGFGADTIDGGDGDDDIKVRDGIADNVTCGAGTDKVDADTLDTVAGDCENVVRTQTAPPDGSDSTAGDTKAPKLMVGCPTLQRVGKKRKLYIQATSSEKGTLAASGRLEVGGLNLALRSKPYKLNVGGGGVEIVITLSKSQMKKVATAFRKRRAAVAKLDVVATDLAGNSVTRKAPKIKLAR